MKRFFDLLIVLLFLPLILNLFIIIWVLVRLSSRGPALYWSSRIGKNNKIFRMPKFRSMIFETPEVATHLLKDPDKYYTRFGQLLRKSSLDEIPQFWCIFIGHMSLVGPRPALYNQYDLIKLRNKVDLDKLLPGLTGWSQINGRDNLSILKKVAYDLEYMKHQCLWFDIKIICLTIVKLFDSKNISN